MDYWGTLPEETMLIWSDLDNKMAGFFKLIAQVFALMGCAFPVIENS